MQKREKEQKKTGNSEMDEKVILNRLLFPKLILGRKRKEMTEEDWERECVVWK